MPLALVCLSVHAHQLSVCIVGVGNFHLCPAVASMSHFQAVSGLIVSFIQDSRQVNQNTLLSTKKYNLVDENASRFGIAVYMHLGRSMGQFTFLMCY